MSLNLNAVDYSKPALAVWVNAKTCIAVRGDRKALAAEVVKQFPTMTPDEARVLCVGAFISAW